MIAKVFPKSSEIVAAAPPSKSCAHRLMIAAALGHKKIRIKNVGSSADVLATAECLSSLGASVEMCGGDAVVTGVFKSGINKTATLDCKESGSTLRFLFPIASALGINAEFLGSGKLLERPNEILFDLLREHGAKVDGFKVKGKLKSGVFEVDASVSSQYITGLLFALPLLEEDSKIILKGKIVSSYYIDITFEVLKLAGIKFIRGEREITIFKNQVFSLPDEVVCEGDWSGAAFLLAAGVMTGKAEAEGLKLNSLQGDKKIADIIATAGGEIIFGEKVTASRSELKGFKADLENAPDLAPITCVLAAAAKGTSEITGISRLKYKESDRIKAICDMLKTAGIKYELKEGGITIFGGEIKGGRFDGYKDHRIVMAAVILALAAKGSSEITNAESVKKSYPEFFEDIKGNGNVFLEG
ncbi:MAG: 3-phosphoshikimate 1-carboxyvinyltransferase [Clostridia bacterium]|nr:3-phosphoshikimate 1-carboxyvinyltransferase [Clostridia bacterium]